jgi:pimeloyl-ACP methyl ester carboxylesterase
MNATLVRDAPLAYQHWRRVEDSERIVLLLHGVGGSRESWSDALSGTGRALAEAGWCAVAADLPGYGHSPTLATYDMAGLALQVLALIEHLQRCRPGAPLALVGHSMGGMVAQEVMVLATPAVRASVRAIVFMATSPAFGKPDGQWQREYLAQRLAPLDAGQGMRKLAPGLAKGMASASAAHDAVARAALLMSAVPEATYRCALQAIVGFDRRAALSELRVPVLCLAGADDRNAPPAVMRQMAERIAHAQVCILPGVGHLMHMEAPQLVNPALVSFLQSNP